MLGETQNAVNRIQQTLQYVMFGAPLHVDFGTANPLLFVIETKHPMASAHMICAHAKTHEHDAQFGAALGGDKCVVVDDGDAYAHPGAADDVAVAANTHGVVRAVARVTSGDAALGADEHVVAAASHAAAEYVAAAAALGEPGIRADAAVHGGPVDSGSADCAEQGCAVAMEPVLVVAVRGPGPAELALAGVPEPEKFAADGPMLLAPRLMRALEQLPGRQ